MKYKLICFDIDGVIFKDINFWMELHKKFNTLEQGKTLTKKYLHSDYDRLVEEVIVKLWKDKDAKPYFDLVNSLEYIPGVKDVFKWIKKNNLITAIISASSIDVAKRIQKEFGVDHIFANELMIKDNKVSGEFIWPIGVGKEKKAEIVKHLREDLDLKKEEVIFVGDSETDIAAFMEVGLSIAFNPTSKEVENSATKVVKSDSLSAILECL